MLTCGGMASSQRTWTSSIFSPPALPFWQPCRSRTLSTWMPRTRETRASKSRSLDAVPNPILEDRRLCLLGRRGLHRAMREPCGMPPRDVRDVATCGASVIVRFRQTHSCQAWKLPMPREWLCTSCMVALKSRLWLDSDLQTFWHTLDTGQVHTFDIWNMLWTSAGTLFFRSSKGCFSWSMDHMVLSVNSYSERLRQI